MEEVLEEEHSVGPVEEEEEEEEEIRGVIG